MVTFVVASGSMVVVMLVMFVVIVVIIVDIFVVVASIVVFAFVEPSARPADRITFQLVNCNNDAKKVVRIMP